MDPVRLMTLWLTVFLMNSCGSESNIFQYLVPEARKNRFDYWLAQAEVAFDQGDYPKANNFARQAWESNPRSERASLILGYSLLGLASVTPFELVNALNQASDEEQSEETALNEPGSSDSTSNTLNDLSGVLGFTKNETLKMGTLDETDSDLPILVPSCAEQARNDVTKLAYIDEALRVACPFVSEDLSLVEELRHGCIRSLNRVERTSQFRFLWAFGHLTEALAFHRVLTWGDAESGKTNLELRLAKIKDVEIETQLQLTQFIADLESLESVVAKVMPVRPQCSADYPTSQLNALLNDMLTVDRTFRAMVGIPEQTIAAVTTTMASIRETREKVGSGVESNKSMKADLNKKMATSIDEKLATLKAEGKISNPAQEEKLCELLESIAGTTGDSESC